MNVTTEPAERFRKGFVLVMTLAYATLFFALINDFLMALLLAAVFSGIVYPLYFWLRNVCGRRTTLASLVTLLTFMAVIVVPLILLLGLVAEQAIGVVEDVKPWIEQHVQQPVHGERKLPDWVPFADQIEPYRERISAKAAELAGSLGLYLATSLGTLTGGTVSFFLNLFIMLYAMFFFLISGPVLIKTIMGYAPLSQSDKDRMLQVSLSVSRATVKGTLISACPESHNRLS